MTVLGQKDQKFPDQGSTTPVMMAVVALSILAASLTAEVGQRSLETLRVESAADAVALAMAHGDVELGRAVAIRNQVRVIALEMTGDHDIGFDVLVTVSATASFAREYVGQARASTKP